MGEANRASADDLLCEGCGYPLLSVEAGASCSECGRDASASDPARRAGSRWQRGASAGSLLASGAALLARPRGFWDRVRIDGASGVRLAAIHAGLAGVLSASPLTLYGGWGLFGILGLGVTALVIGLTWVESAGIRFWGRVHGLRVTRAVAWTICGHASVGWLVGGALAAAGWIAGQAISETDYRVLGTGRLVALAPVAAPVLIAIGGVVGLLTFETLTYLGVRRLRFANPPGARLVAEARG